jgi:hypothetical protein
MTPRRWAPLAYFPIHRRPPLIWPNGAHVALWVNPNVTETSPSDCAAANAKFCRNAFRSDITEGVENSSSN